MEEPDINVTRLAVASQDASKSPYAKPAPPLVCPAWPRAPVPPPMASECAQGPGLPATSALPSPGSPSCLQVTPPEGGSSLPPTGTSVLPPGLAGCGPQVSSPPWPQLSVAHPQAREPASCQRGVDPPLRAAPTDCPGHGARSCPRRAHWSLPETERRGRGHFARVPGVPVAPPASAGERKAGAEGEDSAQAGRRAARRPLTHRPRASADLGGGVLGPHPRTPRGQGSQQHRVACAKASDALTPALQPRRAPEDGRPDVGPHPDSQLGTPNRSFAQPLPVAYGILPLETRLKR